ncbi:terminase [Rhodococcus aerolatus]
MTTSPLPVPPGVVPPRIAQYAPASSHASGDDAIALAASAGLHLDPWQQYALRCSLGERPDGRWSAFRVGLIVGRRNGKTAVLCARELAGLYLFGEQRIQHSAHRFDTAQDAFNFTTGLIVNTPSLARKLKASRNNGIDISKGVEGITLATGQQLRFRSRSTQGGRGLDGDLVVLDEAAYLQDGMMNALVSTMATSPNAQLWYVSTPVDRTVHPDGLVLAKVRRSALAGKGDRQTYLEWSVPEPESGRPEDVDVDDESLWPLANPSLGGRISWEFVRDERDTLSRRGFAVERLGVGDWPREEEAEHLVAPATWAALQDTAALATDPVCFAIDVTPDRRRAAISMACRTPDGRVLLEVIEDRPGTSWVVSRMVELVRRWEPVAVVLDRRSHAATLLDDLIAAGLEPLTTDTGDVVIATGGFLDDVDEGRLAHREPKPGTTAVLTDAVAAATTRDLMGGVALDRRGSGDIHVLVAAVLARWGLLRMTRSPDDKPGPPPESLTTAQVPTRRTETDLATAGF